MEMSSNEKMPGQRRKSGSESHELQEIEAGEEMKLLN